MNCFGTTLKGTRCSSQNRQSSFFCGRHQKISFNKLIDARYSEFSDKHYSLTEMYLLAKQCAFDQLNSRRTKQNDTQISSKEVITAILIDDESDHEQNKEVVPALLIDEQNDVDANVDVNVSIHTQMSKSEKLIVQQFIVQQFGSKQYSEANDELHQLLKEKSVLNTEINKASNTLAANQLKLDRLRSRMTEITKKVRDCSDRINVTERINRKNHTQFLDDNGAQPPNIQTLDEQSNLAGVNKRNSDYVEDYFLNQHIVFKKVRFC